MEAACFQGDGKDKTQGTNTVTSQAGGTERTKSQRLWEMQTPLQGCGLYQKMSEWLSFI